MVDKKKVPFAICSSTFPTMAQEIYEDGKNSQAEANVTMLTRLLALDHFVMGKSAVTCIRESQKYWKSVAHLERRAAQG